MKSNLLTITILPFFITSTANAVEISDNKNTQLGLYGYIYALDYIKGSTSSESSSGTRLGLKSESRITDSISSYARFEWETSTFDSNTNIDKRYAFVGFNFDNIGSLDYGKNNGALRNISYYTDVLPEFGGDSENYTILGGRTASVFTYSNRDFFGIIDSLDFTLQYADKNSVKFKDKSENITVTHETYGLNGQYTISESNLKIGAGYAKSGSDISYILGINYNANNVYLSSIYNQTIVSSVKYTGHESVMAYGIDFDVGHVTSSIAYISYRTETTDKIKYLDFGAQYDMNKQISLLFDYKFNLLENNNDNVVLGLIYYL